jgi:ribosomal protein S12 methylthiotransferase accessory factor
MTVRPVDSEQGITYYNGKGTDKLSAKAGAMMEAIERYSGERCHHPVTFGSFCKIRRKGPAVDPTQVIVPPIRKFNRRTFLEWVQGFDLLQEVPTYVPMNSVLCPYFPESVAPIYYASTNGLASGNTLEEALCHALCEVIERDAMAISCASIELAPAVQSLLQHIGAEHSLSHNRTFPLLSHRGLPRRAALLMKKFKRAGLTVYLRNISCTADLATIDCTIVEPRGGDAPAVHGGCGTHPDARVALIRALTEAAQSRVACIQGGREDLPEVIQPRRLFDASELFGQGEEIPFHAVPSVENRAVDDDVRLILQNLKREGFTQIVAVDMSAPGVGIPVVRVVVPRMEAWTVFHLHTERGYFGTRIAEELTG